MANPANSFDVAGARQAGYSDDDIFNELAKAHKNFDAQGALNAGYSKQEIIHQLSGSPAPAPAPQVAQPAADPRATETRGQMLKRTILQPFKEDLSVQQNGSLWEKTKQAFQRGANPLSNPAARAIGNLVTEGGQKVADLIENQAQDMTPENTMPLRVPQATGIGGYGYTQPDVATVLPADVVKLQKSIVAPAAKTSATKFLAPMAQPESIATMGAFKGVPTTNAAGRLIHAGSGLAFGVPAAKAAIETGPAAIQAAAEGRTPEAVELGTESLTNALVAGETLGGVAQNSRGTVRDVTDLTKRGAQAVAESRPGQMVAEGVQGVRAAWNPEKNLTNVQAATKAMRPRNSKSNWKTEVASALPDMKRAAEASNIDTENMTLEDALNAVSQAKKDVWGEYEQRFLDPTQRSGAAISGDTIADAMVGAITPRMRAQNPGLARTIERKAATYRGQQLSVQQAQDFLTEANGETRAIEAKHLTDKKAAKLDPNQAYKFAERDTLRTELNNVLDQVQGEGGQALRKRWGALNSVEDTLSRRIPVAERRNPVSLTRLLEMVHGPGNILRGIFTGNIGDIAKGVYNTKAMSNAEKMNDPDWLIQQAFSKTQATPPRPEYVEGEYLPNEGDSSPIIPGFLRKQLPAASRMTGVPGEEAAFNAWREDFKQQMGHYPTSRDIEVYRETHAPQSTAVDQVNNREYGDSVTPLGATGDAGVLVRPAGQLPPGTEPIPPRSTPPRLPWGPRPNAARALPPIGLPEGPVPSNLEAAGIPATAEASAIQRAQQQGRGKSVPAFLRQSVPHPEVPNSNVVGIDAESGLPIVKRAGEPQPAGPETPAAQPPVQEQSSSSPSVANQSSEARKPAPIRGPAEFPDSEIGDVFEGESPKRESAAKPEAPSFLRPKASEPNVPRGTNEGSAEAESSNLPGRPAQGVRMVDPKSLLVDPAEMQWRIMPRTSIDPSEPWNQAKAGPVDIWFNPERNQWQVVDGHHRINHALRTNTPEIETRVHEFPSVQDAKMFGALNNIEQGNASPFDAALYLRSTGATPESLRERGVNPEADLVKKASSLANLSGEMWEQYRSGNLDEAKAVAIGQHLTDPSQQKAMAQIAKKEHLSAAEIEQAARRVADQGNTVSETQGLFGADQKSVSNAIETARVAAKVEKQLQNDKTALRFIANAPEARRNALARAENIINVDKSSQEAMLASALVEGFRKTQNRVGPVSQLMEEAGRRITQGENRNAVYNEIYPKLREAILSEIGGATPPPDNGGAVSRGSVSGAQGDGEGARGSEAQEQEHRLGTEGAGDLFRDAPDTPQFRNWFSESKVTDDSGKPKIVFRGDYRADRLGNKFKVNRATSGRFYFTDSPEIASKYAEGKQDINFRDENQNFENWYKFPGLKYKGERNVPDLRQAWWRLSPEQRARVKEVVENTSMNDENDLHFDAGHSIYPNSDLPRVLREKQGNWLKVAEEIWLNSGALYDREGEFTKILDKMGLDANYDNPNDAHSVVTPVYLSIKNPLDTDAIPKSVVEAIGRMAKSDRSRPAEYGVDFWDKKTITPKEWFNALQEDLQNNTTHAWTRVPEKVTKLLQGMGYDGIKDTGGKLGGDKHVVWIAFEPNQIKSAIGNKGTFSPDSDNILLRASDSVSDLSPDELASRAHFRPTAGKNGVPGHVLLNEPAARLVALARGRDFSGMNSGEAGARSIADRLDQYAANMAESNPDNAARISQLADTLRQATDSKDGLNVVVLSPDHTETALRIHEELFHSALQRRPGAGDINRGIPVEPLSKDAGIRELVPHLDQLEGTARTAAIAEAVHDVVIGEHSLDSKTAGNTIKSFFDAMVREHGESILNDADALAAHMEEQFGAILGNERGIHGQPAQQAIASVRQELKGSGRGLPWYSGRKAGGSTSPESRTDQAQETAVERPMGMGLSDSELGSWIKGANSLHVEAAGEQPDLFGNSEKVFQLIRTAPDGTAEKHLVSESRLREIENTPEFRKAQARGQQEKLFGEQQVGSGELYGAGSRGITLPPQASRNQGTLFRGKASTAPNFLRHK